MRIKFALEIGELYCAILQSSCLKKLIILLQSANNRVSVHSILQKK